MHNPPHPGEFIREVYLSELQMSVEGATCSLVATSRTLICSSLR